MTNKRVMINIKSISLQSMLRDAWWLNFSKTSMFPERRVSQKRVSLVIFRQNWWRWGYFEGSSISILIIIYVIIIILLLLKSSRQVDYFLFVILISCLVRMTFHEFFSTYSQSCIDLVEIIPPAFNLNLEKTKYLHGSRCYQDDDEKKSSIRIS